MKTCTAPNGSPDVEVTRPVICCAPTSWKAQNNPTQKAMTRMFFRILLPPPSAMRSCVSYFRRKQPTPGSAAVPNSKSLRQLDRNQSDGGASSPAVSNGSRPEYGQ